MKVLNFKSKSSGPLSRPLSLPLSLSLLAHARRCSVCSRQWPRRDGRPMHSRGVWVCGWVCVCVCALSVSLVWRWRWSMSLEPSGALALDLPRGIGKCGLGLKTSTCSRCRPALASCGEPLSTRLGAAGPCSTRSWGAPSPSQQEGPVAGLQHRQQFASCLHIFACLYLVFFLHRVFRLPPRSPLLSLYLCFSVYLLCVYLVLIAPWLAKAPKFLTKLRDTRGTPTSGPYQAW